MIRFLARVWLTVVFLLSGSLKVWAPDRFLLDVRAFELAPYVIAFVIALILPWVEIFGALALWWPRLARSGALLLAFLAFGFIVALASAFSRGIELDCGCFGDWLVFPSLWMHLLFNSSLAAAGLFLGRNHSPRSARSRPHG